MASGELNRAWAIQWLVNDDLNTAQVSLDNGTADWLADLFRFGFAGWDETDTDLIEQELIERGVPNMELFYD